MFEKNHKDHKETIKVLEKYFIGDIDDGFLYHFECCLMKTQPVNKIFKNYLKRIHSNGTPFTFNTLEILECIEAIANFKETLTLEAAEAISKVFLEKESQSEINIDHQIREDILSKIKRTTFQKDMFRSLEETLFFELKSGAYNTFLSSDEFKVWISSKYQTELLKTMDSFLIDFGNTKNQKLEEETSGCDACIIL